MNPYEKVAEAIIDLCTKAITGELPHLADPVVFVYYTKLKEDVVDVLCDFESEVRKPIPL